MSRRSSPTTAKRGTQPRPQSGARRTEDAAHGSSVPNGADWVNYRPAGHPLLAIGLSLLLVLWIGFLIWMID